MTSAGRVVALRRYPVKSMRGETRDSLDIDERGVVGDRLWAVRDGEGKLGSGKNTHRFRRMDGLFGFAAAYCGGEPSVPLVTSPDGRVLRADDPALDRSLSKALGLNVRLFREGAVSHLDASPIHIVTTAALDRLGELLPDVGIDERRFRPNLVLSLPDSSGHAGDFPENAWIGRELHVGGLRLAVTGPTERCVMVNNAQENLTYDSRVLRTLALSNDLNLGVYGDVLDPGVVRLGDTVELA